MATPKPGPCYIVELLPDGRERFIAQGLTPEQLEAWWSKNWRDYRGLTYSAHKQLVERSPAFITLPKGAP